MPTVMMFVKNRGPAMNNFVTITLIGLFLLLNASSGLADLAQDPGPNPHGTMTFDCSQCHATESWTKLQSELQFEHSKTRFPLIGRHIQVTCRQCHSSLVFSDAGSECLNCHLDIHQGQFSQSCSECHTPQGWSDESQMYIYHQQARFPLTGVHASLDCQICHAAGEYTGLPLDCQGCHLQAYYSTQNPNHSDAGFSLQCAECHSLTVARWKTSYQHTPAFPLTAGHDINDCSRCHQGSYAETSAECVACHRADYNTAANPNHVVSQFPQTCDECHTTGGWRPAAFNHNLAQFPLTGAHASVACASCHLGGQYTGTSTVCYDCHRSDYDAAEEPDHATAQFPQSCEECHTTDVWQPSTFNHSNTQFQLTGAHIRTDCAQCHLNGQFSGTTTACFGCHQLDYEGVQEPNHVDGQYPQECTICHNTEAWQPSLFQHSQTNFPLTGAHVLVSCAQCHVNGQYTGTPTECYACHQSDYEEVTDPNHVAGNYPQNCTVCHSTEAWQPASFDHAQTSFPLTGSHVQVNCALCHVNGQYTGTPTECYACHQSDYEEVTDPNHVAGNYPHDCTICHNTSDWDDANFDHNQTDFPLTGSHIQVNCAQCHVNGQYTGTPTECYACHQSDYEGVDDPNHVTDNYPHDCTICHNTSDWDDANFDHNQTDFPLTGAHISVTCLDCHLNGQYTGTPTDCFFCHETDYNNTQDPDHAAAGFPQDCAVCHSTFNWDAQFNHDGLYFPIYSGRHRNEWDRCSDCHTDPNNYAVFSCIICHEHNCSDMADEHDEVAGFVCESNACYACHPNGDSGDRIHRMPVPTPRIK
ncbi:MAG: hypothetical protein ACOZB3_06160 [Calditrichota bacterium]